MSSACPGAKPTPLQRVVCLLVITHAKPLCLVFCTEASLTRESNPFATQMECIADVGWHFVIGPKSGHCHSGRCCQNWSTKEVNKSQGASSSILGWTGITGSGMVQQSESVGVTGCPSKA